MASIVDSIRSVYQDNYSLLKLGGFSYFIYLLVGLITPGENINIMNIILWLVIYYIFLGFCSIIINNRITQNIQTLPSFDPIKFINISSKAFIISLPYLVIGYFVVNMIIGMFNFEGVPQQVALWLIRFFIFSFLITALINFSEKHKISDGFNISKLLSGVADVLVFTILCLILIAIYSAFVVCPTLYLIYSFFDIGPLFKYVAVFFTTLNLAYVADYWGQLHFDIESKNNYY